MAKVEQDSHHEKCRSLAKVNGITAERGFLFGSARTRCAFRATVRCAAGRAGLDPPKVSVAM